TAGDEPYLYAYWSSTNLVTDDSFHAGLTLNAYVGNATSLTKTANGGYFATLSTYGDGTPTVAIDPSLVPTVQKDQQGLFGWAAVWWVAAGKVYAITSNTNLSGTILYTPAATTCVPFTCDHYTQSNNLFCGSPSDGCGGALRCGCANGA